MGRENKIVEVDFDRIQSETEKGFQLVIDGKKIWFPKSQCEIASDANVVLLPEWLAIEKEVV